MPLIWKLAKVNPLPKECPLTECGQLRSISLTNITRLFERVVTTHFTDMCIPNYFSLPNGVRRSTFDAGLVTKFGAFSSLNFPKLI